MNMTKSAFLFVLLLFSVRAFGQTDTIFSNNEKIPCIVKEIKESFCGVRASGGRASEQYL